MAGNIYQGVDPQVITLIARNLLAEEDRRANVGDILADWFPLIEVNSLDYTYSKGTTRTYTEAAPFRAFDTPAPIGTRPGRAWARGSMPPISLKYPFGELDRLKIRALQEQAKVDDLLATEILDDVARGVRAIRNRMSSAAAELLVEGTLTIEENGLKALEVDPGRSANRVATAATAWSVSASATPFANEKAALQVLRDEADLYPEDLVVMCNQATWDEYIEIDEVISAYQSVRQLDRLSDEMAQVVRGEHNLPNVIINDKKVKPVGGVAANLIPDGKWIYMPRPGTETLGNTQYGRPAIADHSDLNLSPTELPGIVSYIMEGVDPYGLTTVVDGIAIPTMNNPDATYVLNV